MTEILRSKIRAEKEEEISGEKDDNDDDIMDVIIRNSTRLKQLTEDILDITRIEIQALTLHKEQFCLNEVILHAITDTRNQLEKEQRENIRFMLNPEQGMDDLTVVIADKQRITQVISNLLDNAVEFTKQGIITIRTEEKKDNNNKEVIVSIKDTGTGITRKVLPRLFTKFATTSRKGTGLGLYICKNIVEAHGGRIWGENNPDGNGAAFTISLPTPVPSITLHSLIQD